jgi:hypothetical protein
MRILRLCIGWSALCYAIGWRTAVYVAMKHYLE